MVTSVGNSDRWPTPDIIGIGAVNVDHIVDSTGLRSADGERDGSAIEQIGFDYGSERPASPEQIRAALAALEPFDPVTSPGGSSLNTVATIAAATIPVTVGFVGTRGTSPDDRFSFPQWFADLGIDDRFVTDVDEPTGTCLSYTDGGQRSLMTTDGANRHVMEHIESHGDALVRYCSRARVILVTSFAGLTAIDPLVELVGAVRRRSPESVIVCDPGAMWTRDSPPHGVDALHRLSDWLMVNGEEFDALTKRAPGEGLEAAAGRVLQQSEVATPGVVLKDPHRITVFTRPVVGGAADVFTVENDVVVSPEDVIDDTGTGDAFAGGFLSSLVSEELRIDDGIRLGQRLAAEKLGWAGLSGLDRYPAVYRRFRRDLERDRNR